MGQFKKGNTIGKEYRFSSENQPKKNGRKPALYNQLRKLTGKHVKQELSKEDYYKIIQYLLERTPAELKLIIENAKQDDGTTPVWVLSIISAIQSDLRYGRTRTIDSIFDRLFGKATQPVESDVNANVTNTMDLSNLTTDELIEYNKLLDKLNGKKV